MFRIRTLVLAIALVLLGATVPAFAQTGGIAGKALLQDGTPCVKCIIVIDRQEIKGSYTVKTDKKGNYTYIGLPLGNYKVTLEDPNGKALYNFNGKHIGMGDPTEVNFDLKQEAAIQQKEHPEIAKQAEEQLKEQKQSASLMTFFNQGQAAMTAKNYPDAIAAFEQALPLATGKNQVIVLQSLADAYHRARQNDKAVEMYQKVIAADPTNADFHNNLGSVYADMRKIPEAQAEFQKAAELNPSGASRYYFNLGVIMVNSNNMDAAAEALKKCTDLDPKNADAFYWYGMALLGKMQYKPDGTLQPVPGTVEAFQTYLQLAPDGQYATAAQASVAQLQGKVETEYKKPKKK
jgi:tetratricopeptide (TPR) repeat protein